MPDEKLGIEVLSDVVVETFNVVHDVRDSLPKIDVGDLPRLFDALKNGKALLFTNWKQAVAEGRDLEHVED